MKYRMNDQGVEALKKLSGRLQDQIEAIKQSTDALDEEFSSNKSGLGVHADDIQKVIDAMNEEVQQASSPVGELAEKINTLASSYQEFINTKRFTSGGN